MLSLSLPVPSLLCRLGSLKTANRLPAGRHGGWVPKYLIWIALLTRSIVDLWLRIDFSPCFQGGAGMRRGGLRRIAARGSRVVPGQSRRPVRRPPVQALRHSPCEEARKMADAAFFYDTTTT